MRVSTMLVIENIALIAAMAFLVWATSSGWWVLLCLFGNSSSAIRAQYKTEQNNGCYGRG